MALISTPTSLMPEYKIDPENFKSSSYPKLIVVAEEDFRLGCPFAKMAKTIFYFMSEPKQIKTFPGSHHSMKLLHSKYRQELVNLLIILK
jgi:hypothetical protein